MAVRFRCNCWALAGALPVLACVGDATAIVWDGGGTDTRWSTPANWAGDVVPNSGATVEFASAGGVATLDSDRTVFRLDFISAVTGNFLIESPANHSLQVNASNIRVTAATGDFGVAAPLKLNATGGVTTIWSANTDASQTTVVFSGPISDAGATSQALIMSGTIGGVTLSGANTYTGGTTLNAGRLTLNNTSGSATGAGNVTLNSGTLTTGNSASIAASLTAGTGPHLIAPGDGDADSIGSLDIGGTFLINRRSTLRFDVLTESSRDLIMAGTLSFAPADPGQAAVEISNSALTAGTYTLIAFSSTTLTDASKFQLAAGSPGNYSLSLDTVAKKLNLVVVPEPSVGWWLLPGLVLLNRRRRQQG